MLRHLRFAVVCLAATPVVVSVAACSSSSTEPGNVTADSGQPDDTGSAKNDTGTVSDDTSMPATDTGSTGTDTGTTVADTGATDANGDGTDAQADTTSVCPTPLTTLHQPGSGAKTIVCPFSAPDGGTAMNCDPSTEHCCETPMGAATAPSCTPTATACTTGSVDWQCQDPIADCKDPSKPICCAPGATIGLGNPGCGNFAHTMKGTACVAAGACAGIVMCSSDAECTAPMRCTAFGKAGAEVGGCM